MEGAEWTQHGWGVFVELAQSLGELKSSLLSRGDVKRIFDPHRPSGAQVLTLVITWRETGLPRTLPLCACAALRIAALDAHLHLHLALIAILHIKCHIIPALLHLAASLLAVFAFALCVVYLYLHCQDQEAEAAEAEAEAAANYRSEPRSVDILLSGGTPFLNKACFEHDGLKLRI
jgi:hypothetical protein